MQRTFAVLIVLVVLVAAIGFHRGWFGVTSHSGADGNDVIGELSALLEELTRRLARGLRHGRYAVAGRRTSDATTVLFVGAGRIELSTPTVSR